MFHLELTKKHPITSRATTSHKNKNEQTHSWRAFLQS